MEQPYIDSTFLRLLDAFEQIYSTNIRNPSHDYALKLRSLTIELSDDIELPTAGVCVFDAPRYILINRYYWHSLERSLSTKSLIKEEILLFHELGHCVFDRMHREDLYEDKCPRSLMSSVLMTPKCFVKHYNELIYELPRG